MNTQTIAGEISTGISADLPFEITGPETRLSQTPVPNDLVTRALVTLLNREPVDVDSAMLALSQQADESSIPSSADGEPLSHASVSDLERTGSDRREFPRRCSSGDLRFAIVPDALAAELAALQGLLRSKRAKGSVIDISQTGVAFICESSLLTGSHLAVMLPGGGGLEPVQVTAKIIRCQQIDQNNWKVVCQFLAPLTFEEAYSVGETAELPTACLFERPL